MPLNPSTKIEAKPPRNFIGTVNEGERWNFKPGGTWTDWFYTCDAGGYRVVLFEFLGIRPARPFAPLFALVAQVENPASGAVVERFVIGRGLEHTFTESGNVFVEANDLPQMRDNNKGWITLTATRAANIPAVEPDDPTGAPTLLDRWLALVGILDCTPGFAPITVLLMVLGLTLAMSQQGRDLIAAIAGSTDDLTPMVWLCFTTFILGFQAWFWARAIVEYQFADRANWRDQPVLVWTPRVLGLLPYVFLVIALATAPIRAGIAALVLAGMAGGFLVFLIFRARLAGHLKVAHGRQHDRGNRVTAGLINSVLNLKVKLLALGLLGSLGSMILVVVCKVGPARYVGPAAVVLLAAALLIPVITILIQIGHRYRVPALLALLVLALVSDLARDGHQIRLLKDDGALIARRPDLDAAYRQWRAQAEPDRDGNLPIVFVAAPGGASRAGFWTSLALGRLEERSEGQFSKHLFAISSISGSSVGAVGFLASLADNPGLAGQRRLQKSLEEFSAYDFLSPALAGMFFPDLLQRFIPLSVLPDRAEYLEDGFEAGWTKHCALEAGRCGQSDLLSHGFLSLWQNAKRPWLPALVIGGTWEENGQRILTSNLKLDDVFRVEGAKGVTDADDFFATAQQDVRLSTAIDNGARFPYLSPSGTVVAPATLKTPKHEVGHIVDGGYFEAAGLETLRQIADRVVADHPKDKLKVIFIVLYNYNVGAVPMDYKNFASDLIGPLRGLLNIGPAHGEHLRNQLLNNKFDAACTADTCVPVQEIKACGDTAPLDWTLSTHTRDDMKDQLMSDSCGNRTKVNNIAIALGARP